MRVETVYSDEVRRWEVHHSPEAINAEGNPGKDATFARVVQKDDHPASTYLVLFAESDDAGAPRLSMNLWPDTLDELIRDLQDARAAIRTAPERSTS